MIICGFSLIGTPLITFMSAGYYIIIMFFMFGVVGVIQGIAAKRFGMNFVFAILSVILGIIGLCRPGAVLMADFTLLYFAAAWFILHAVLTLVNSLRYMSGGRRIFGIILGILEIILGIYSVAHPMVLALTIGFLIGFYFIESGFNLIFAGSLFSAVKKEMKKEM